MADLNRITVGEEEFEYDLDPDFIFNFTSEHVEYLYATKTDEHASIKTLHARDLNPKKNLKMRFVLKCRTLNREPLLVIIATDILKRNHIFCYDIVEKQLVQALSKKKLDYKITQASITNDPFKVAFLGSQMSDSETCYGLAIGTETGTAAVILLKIEESTFEASVMSVERMVSEKEGSNLGSVTAIHILHSGDGDKRMGHGDPQIALGYSLGSVFIYRFRASVYASSASRFRAPVDLSEYTEFREHPIACISCARSYNSLAMSVAFVQEKPRNVAKYEYSNTYIKLVEIHSNLTHRQRKIINPEQPLSTVMDATLLASSFTTAQLDNIIQLSILYENSDTFGLNIWYISPYNIHEKLNINVEKEIFLNRLLYHNKLRSDNVIGFFRFTPQKLVQRMLQYENNPYSCRMSRKRRIDDQSEVIDDQGKVAPIKRKRGRPRKNQLPVRHSAAESSFESDSDQANDTQKKSEDDSFESEPFTDDCSSLSLQRTDDITEELLDEPTLVESTEEEAQLKIIESVEKSTEVAVQMTQNESAESEAQVESTDSFGKTTEVITVFPQPDQLDEARSDEEPTVITAQIKSTEFTEARVESTESTEARVESNESGDQVESNEFGLIAQSTEPVEQTTEPIADTSQKDTPADNNVESLLDKLLESVAEPQQIPVNDKAKEAVEEAPPSPLCEALLKSIEDPPLLLEEELNAIKSIIDHSDNHVEVSSADQPEKPDDVNNNVANFDDSAKVEEYQELSESANVNNDIEKDVDSNEVDKIVELGRPNDVNTKDEENKKYIEINRELNELEESTQNSEGLANNDIADDYVIVDIKNILKESVSQSDEPQLEEQQSKEPLSEEPQSEEPQLEKEEEDECTAMDVDDDHPATNASDLESFDNKELEKTFEEEADYDYPNYCDDEEMNYDDSNYYDDNRIYAAGKPKRESILDEECILLSSDDGEEEEEKVEENHNVGTTDDHDSIMTDRISDVSSLQQSFIPASNSSTQDTPPPPLSTQTPTVDYVPVMQQNLVRLLHSSMEDLPSQSTNSSTIHTEDDSVANTESDMIGFAEGDPIENIESESIANTGSDMIGNTEDYPNEIGEDYLMENAADDLIEKEKNDLTESMEDQSNENPEPVLASKEPEPAPEMLRELEIQQNKDMAQNDFSNLLYEILEDESIDNFMNKPLIPQEKLDDIGSSCWFNPNPYMKLLLLRYCYKHNMREEIVSLCKVLSSTAPNFTKEEDLEYKNIYRSYLRDYPSYNQGEVVNIFHQESRQQLLQREMDYYKSNRFTSDTNQNQKKHRKSYMQYYGFGLR